MDENNIKNIKNSSKFDDLDIKILNILMQNSRTKMTKIARTLHTTTQTVKNRIVRMKKKGLIKRFTVQVNSEMLGYSESATVFLKIMKADKDQFNELINFLKHHKNIIDLIGVIGDYNLSFIIISKTPEEMDEILNNITYKFKDIISDMKTIVMTKIYKLEEYTF